MTQESGNLLHLCGFVASGAKTQRLKKCSSSNERMIVPESNSVSHRRITLGKQILKLVGLEVISDSQITTKPGPSLTFPSFVTELLPLYNLHQSFGVRIISIHHHHQAQHYQSKNKEKATFRYPHFRSEWKVLIFSSESQYKSKMEGRERNWKRIK